MQIYENILELCSPKSDDLSPRLWACAVHLGVSPHILDVSHPEIGDSERWMTEGVICSSNFVLNKQL